MKDIEYQIKELIKERKEMFDKEDVFYAQYDKGYIHACGEILELIRTNEIENEIPKD